MHTYSSAQNNPFALINKTFQIIDCNTHFKEIFSLEAGEDIIDIFSGTDSLQMIYNFVNSNMDNFIFEHVISDGNWFTIHVQKVSISNEVLSVVYFIHAEEKKVIESKINNYHSLIEYGDIPVAVTDQSLKIIYISYAFEKIFNIHLEKLYHTHIVSFISTYMTMDEIKELQSYLSMKRNWKKTIHISTNNYYEVRFIPVDDVIFNFSYYIVAINDITPHMLYQKQLQEAYKKELHLNKLKTAFLENMSHEIRTPLNAVIGYSEFINDCIESSNYNEIKDFSDAIKDVLKRIMNLFNNIVEYSQIENGEVVLEKEEININAVLKGVILKKEQQAHLKKINLCYFNLDESMVICSDWIKLEKIFLELVDNAIKYTDRGEVIIKVEKYGQHANIQFIDTGKGMKESEIERLLQPFEQEETGYTRSTQGAGLGLSIANGLTKLLGGDIHIKTLLNSGTKVQVQFPLLKRTV